MNDRNKAVDDAVGERAIYLTSITLILVTSLLLMFAWVTGTQDEFSMPAFGLFLLAGVGAQYLMRIDRKKTAAWLLLVPSLLGMAFMSTLSVLGQSFAVSGYIIIMCLVIVILPGRAWIGVLIFAIVGTIFTTGLQLTNGSEVPIVDVVISGISMVSFLLVATMTVGLIYTHIGRIIALTQQANHDLIAANNALRKSHDHSRTLMEVVVDPFFLVNEQLQVIDTNQRASDMLGFTKEEFASLNIFKLAPAVTTEMRLEAVRIIIEKGEYVSDVVKLYRKDGTHFYAEISGRSIMVDGSRLYYVVVRDISELYRAKESLQRSNDILNHVINNIPARISYINREGTIIFINDRVEADFGFSAESKTGSNIADVLSEEYRAEINQYIVKAFRSQREVVFEAPLVRHDGVTVIERSYYYPHVVNGRTEALFTLHMDVTDIRRTEDSLARAQKLESLGILAGGIAHDFNNLLVAMLGQNSIALAKMEKTHPARRHIERAVEASKRAASLTQQMLAYSGRGSFSIGDLNINELIENNLRLFAVSIPKNVQLVTNLNEDLPTIEADVAQMQQLIMNLILNAGQAIGDAQGRITITTDVQTIAANHGDYWEITGDPLVPGRYVSIEIQDDGVGMDEETMNRIFDPFFTTKEHGTGLGLAAALGIIRGHSGGIRLYSEVGRGTVFRLLFPATELLELPDVDEAVKSAEASPLFQQHILIIDDEVAISEVVSEMLLIEGVHTLRATNGSEGVQLFRQNQDKIALVLLDLMMPGMNGEETFRALRAIDPDVRVILSSGYSEAEATRKFIGRGLADFLQKPYDFDTLISKVTAVLHDADPEND